MPSNPTPEWKEMASDCLKAASIRTHIRDFKQICGLRRPSSGKSYYDRLRVADVFIASQIIAIVDEKLVIVAREFPDWLLAMFEYGDDQAEEFRCLIDPTGILTNKFDRSVLEMIGTNGELHVLQILRRQLPETLHQRIRHVAKVDDSAGFDIATPSVRNHALEMKLEVKVMARKSKDFRFFISRNEVSVGLASDQWYLVALDFREGQFKLVGAGRITTFSDELPVDISSFAKWESARVIIPRSRLAEGLP